ncbi:MAG TPA: ABC transporter permease [Firmicutes bacterium]|nr:ABC transporter permease [Bacillota bacterium]
MLREFRKSAAKAWRRNPIIRIGTIIFVVVLLVAVLAPYISQHDPLKMNPLNRLKGPSRANWFGTDELGRDVFSRVVFGARTSLQVGLSVVFLTILMGAIIGLLAGFFKKLDGPIMRIMDGFLAMPSELVAISLMASLGPSVNNVILALSIAHVPRMARLLRSSVLVVREMNYVEAAEALGVPVPRVLLKHVLPNCLSPLIVQATSTFAFAVLSEASLSFLGVGLPPYVPSWGTILSGGRQFMMQAPWITMFPGMSIILTVLSLNLLGDGLRDLLDPKLRKIAS